jgi:transposase
VRLRAVCEEAIAEAVDRQNMRFVPIKTDDQLDLQAVHRMRDRFISRPTAVINQLRAFLRATRRRTMHGRTFETLEQHVTFPGEREEW